MLAWALVCTVAGLLAYSTAGQSLPATLPGPVPREYWGLHIHRAGSLETWPADGFGSWRLWDAHVNWADLEPRRGEWRFDALDRYVDLARQRNVEILLPLGMSPSWASARPGEASSYGAGATAEPTDLQHWRDYVTTVARRYQGRVRHYEIWNEPNVKSLKSFYTGSVASMVELAREAFTALKAIDPAIVVVSPAVTRRGGIPWLEEYLRGGGAEYADVIGFHFYVAPAAPEAMVPLVREVQRVLRRHGVNKPLWNTESGWKIESRQASVATRNKQGLYSRVTGEEEAAAFVARSYVLSWSLGVGRLYWYAWDNYLMGLVEPDARTVKPAGRAYEGVQRWLSGAEIRRCEVDQGQTWGCHITRGSGYEAWIVWNPEKRMELAIPDAWKIRRVRELAGGERMVAAGERVAISPLPIMLER